MKTPGKLRAKSLSQPVNLPRAWPLMNPLCSSFISALLPPAPYPLLLPLPPTCNPYPQFYLHPIPPALYPLSPFPALHPLPPTYCLSWKKTDRNQSVSLFAQPIETGKFFYVCHSSFFHDRSVSMLYMVILKIVGLTRL